MNTPLNSIVLGYDIGTFRHQGTKQVQVSPPSFAYISLLHQCHIILIENRKIDKIQGLIE
jgi:hypothetical protein